jgi:cytoskeleton protein RodZ
MTESQAIPETPAAAAPEPAAASFGAALRAAREASGMSAAALASRLRLHVKQIEALERCDLSALPSVIYVRGFLRSCARELKIDPLPLLAALDRQVGVTPGEAAEPVGRSFPLSRFGDGSKPIIAVILAIVIVAGLVGTLMPRHPSQAPAPAATPASAPAAVPEAPAANPPAALAPGAAETAVPAAEAGVARNASGAGAALRPSGKAAGSRPSTGPAPAARTVPEAPAASTEPAPSAVAAPEAAPAADALVLRVHAPSWVEVVQANGTAVFSQICQPGTTATIHGTAPLRIVIGNAAAVEAQYRGAPVDLVQHANANGVARMTLP